NGAVEERALPGQARIDRVATFVRRPPPVARSDDEALAGKLALQGDVVDVAADGDPPVGLGPNEALDERLRVRAAPRGEVRRRDFRKGDLAYPAGTHRVEEAAIAKVARHHVGDLAPE